MMTKFPSVLGAVILCSALSAGASAMAQSNEARSRMPEVIEWQGHYLILQGENFLPVTEAVATPNVTIFEVEKDYLPSSAFSKLDSKSTCSGYVPQKVTDTGSATTAAIAEAATDQATDMRARQYCPQDLGSIWGSGSYVYDDSYNQLAGQDFSEGANLRLGSFLFEDQDEPKDFLIINEGGPKRADDPALSIYSYDNGFIVDYPVDGSTEGNSETGMGEEGVQPAPDLPVTVTYQLSEGVPLSDGGYADLDTVMDAIDVALSAASADAEPRTDALIVSRGVTPETEEVYEKRLQAIRKKIRAVLGSNVNIKTVSFGDALPLCADDTPQCWSANRSTLVYFK